MLRDTFGDLGNHTIDGDTEAPTAPSSLTSSNVTETTLDLSWTASTDNVGVASYDVYQDAALLGNTSSTSYSVSGLTAGTSYDFYVIAKDAAGNQSTASNTETVSTNSSSSGGSASDLILSEYVEGSSNNKALEIANFTGSSVDLSDYDLRKVTNGSGSYGSTYQLSGTLADGDVYVIANSNANSSITSVADVTTGSGIVTFNGNDAIGLFKNGSLIDEIGDPNSSSAFAQDTTLRRKSSVSSPNTTYTVSEWDSFATDTSDGLGSHTMDGASGPTSIILNEAYFETGWDTWIDGGGDAARYSGSRSYEGSYSIRIRDNSSTASSMTTPEYNLTGFDMIETTFHFYVYSMETGEDFWFRYHDGSSWQTVQAWIAGTDMFNNNFYSATVTMDASSYNFVSNGKFRFQCDASANADQIYIDQVTITGISNVSARGSLNGSDIQFIKSLDTSLESFTIYPNPVEGSVLNIELNDEEPNQTTYRILSVLGQVIKTGNLNEGQVSIDQLKSGVYLLELTIDD